MDLKSGSLFWPAQDGHTRRRYPPLQRDLHCDVAIIGAGLTGALVGLALTKGGIDAVLLDKRNVAQGSTSASTALILYEIDTPLFELIRMRGRRAAVRSYELCRRAIGQIERLTDELDDDCGFERKLSLYCAQRPSHLTELKKELRARNQAGFNVEYLTAADLVEEFSFHAPAALLSPEAAQIDPYRFTHCLVEHARKKGLRVFGGTRVARLEQSHSGVTLQTASGKRVMAKKIVVAAGYESQEYLRRDLVKLKSTYALATAPLTNFGQYSHRCVIWETGRPYCYLRTTADHRIIIGGQDEDFVNPSKRDRLIRSKSEALREKVEAWFPHLTLKTACAWAGTFGETEDGLPLIGSLRGMPNIIFALCYGANGTNFGVIAADLIRDQVLGRRNADAGLFSLDR